MSAWSMRLTLVIAPKVVKRRSLLRENVDFVVVLPVADVVEGDIFGMFNGNAVAAFQVQNERPEWYGSQQTLEFSSSRSGSGHGNL